METRDTETIYDLKKSIAKKLQVPVGRLKLSSEAGVIDDSYDVKNVCTIKRCELSVEILPVIDEDQKKAGSNFQGQGVSNYDKLPGDVASRIFKMVTRSPNDLCQLSLVCSAWGRIIQDDGSWSRLVELRFSEESQIKKMNWVQLRGHYVKNKISLVALKMSNGFILSLYVCSKYDMLEDLKQEIFRKKGFPIELQTIILKGHIAEGNKPLREYKGSNQGNGQLTIKPPPKAESSFAETPSSGASDEFPTPPAPNERSSFFSSITGFFFGL